MLGGKITVYRRLAEEAHALLASRLGGVRQAWTAKAPLPGGDIDNGNVDNFIADLQRQYRGLPPELLHRYARAYGTRAHRVLGGASGLASLGKHLGDGIFEAEIDYLVQHEWARTTADILWRRSKLGLRVAPETSQQLNAALPAFLSKHKK